MGIYFLVYACHSRANLPKGKAASVCEISPNPNKICEGNSLTFSLRPFVIKLNLGINSGIEVSTPGFHRILSGLGLENLIPFLEGVCISIRV